MMALVYKAYGCIRCASYIFLYFFVMATYASPELSSLEERYSDYIVFCIQGESKKLEVSTARPKDHLAALRWSKENAIDGNWEAMVYLGACVHDGREVPKNKEEALRLYRKAENAGSRNAIGMLGFYQLSDLAILSNKATDMFSDSSVFAEYVPLPVEVLVEILSSGMVQVEGFEFSEKNDDLQELSNLIKGMREIGTSQGIKTVVNILPHQNASHVQMVNLLEICANIEGLNVYLLQKRCSLSSSSDLSKPALPRGAEGSSGSESSNP